MDFKKTVIYDLVILICAASLLTATTLMWFQINKTVQSEGITLTSGSTPNISFDFYIKHSAEEDWVQTNRLEVEKMVPGQTVYCKLKLNNDGNAQIAAAVDFLQILDGESQDNIKLSDVLIFTGIGPEGVSFANTDDFATLMAGEDHFRAVTNATINADSHLDILFNISVDEKADNDYSEKTLSVGQISITTSNVTI